MADTSISGARVARELDALVRVYGKPDCIVSDNGTEVRATLYAAANALLMRTMAGSQIKSWGMRLMRTKGRRRAVVAVARKLAVLLHRMWVDGTEFRQDQVGGAA
jgi:transposase